MLLDVQPVPARHPWSVQVDAVLAAEAAGFGVAWMVDHLSGAAFRGDTMVECFTQLGSLATVTAQIGLGTLVANVTNRSAGLLAVAAASVQTMSGGRFVLGLGAGTSPTSPFAAEQHAIGRPPAPRLAARHDHLAAVLDEVESQWARSGAPPYEGFPRPEPAPPPIILGVNSRRLATLAGARINGVNVRWNHPDRAGIIAAAVEARAARPVPPGWWTSSVWAPWDDALCDPDHPTRGELAAEGVDRLILAWTDPPSAASWERAAARLR